MKENSSLIKDDINKLKETLEKKSKEEKTEDIDVKKQKQFRARRAKQCLVFMTRCSKIEWFRIGKQSKSWLMLCRIFQTTL